MNPQRYLCSHLVALKNNSRAPAVNLFANLEEIWASGAVLEAEEPMDPGTNLELRGGSATFVGRVMQVERHELGWRLEVEFSPLTPWTVEKFAPQHLLDLSKRERSKRDQGK
ncbi:MAG TPA: hypothetical protein VHY84_19100 [Bryobacteraceae bacterium]|jgi:hypothetical protein|nr:hypothetical protein [Bryobacteraceae bacterium]